MSEDRTVLLAADEITASGSCGDADRVATLVGEAAVPAAVNTHFLVVLLGPPTGRKFPVVDGMVIGRGSGAGVCLTAADVSRNHARISRAPAGQFLVEDLGSSNGTLVNGEPLDAPRELRFGDRIAIGTRTLLLYTRIDPLETQLSQADRLRSMGQLAAAVAHEINNPLTFVLHNLETLGEALPSLASSGAGLPAAESLADAEEQLRAALEGARRVRDIVRDLRSFSRTDEDLVAPVALGAAMDKAISMAHNQIKYRARLVKRYAEDPVVLANEGRLGQVFLNLLLNAAQAIPEGRQRENAIEVHIRAKGPEALVEVRDTGAGISAENLARVFEPFFTTREAELGTGLGLAICRSIVVGYGGRIEAASEEGVGSRFLVRLPITARRVAERPQAQTAEVARHEVHGRVLAVDDEPHILRALGRLLGKQHTVQTCGSGAEAQLVLQSDPSFDVVLCDLMMPDMTGIELHGWVQGFDPELAERFLFMTGGAFTEEGKRFLSTVGNRAIEKPFEPEEVHQLVNELVARRAN